MRRFLQPEKRLRDESYTNKLQMFKANISNSSQQEILSCRFCDHVSPNINKLWLILCYLRAPFQLASPSGFHVTHIPKGNLVLLCVTVFFWYIGILFLFRPPVFSRVHGSVERREPTRTPRASWGPGRGPRHVLRGFKMASPLGEGYRARRAIQAPANPRTGSKNVRRLM